jgi:hypothetical protein
MTQKPPDSPGDASVDDELTPETRESMERLGQPDVDDAGPDPAERQGDDQSGPGQNSDWLPQ